VRTAFFHWPTFLPRPLGVVMWGLTVLMASAGVNATAQAVILVQIDPRIDMDPAEMYANTNEAARYQLSATEAGPLLTPNTGAGYQEAGCFIADFKLIYRDYTYVLSTYCTHALKFKNSAAFTPSSQRMPADFQFTNERLDKIEKTSMRVFSSDFSEYFQQLQLADEQFIDEDDLPDTPDPAEYSLDDVPFDDPVEDARQSVQDVEQEIDQVLENVPDNPVTDAEEQQELESNDAFQGLDEELERELGNGSNP